MSQELTEPSYRSNSTSIISSLSNGNLAHVVTDTDGSMTVDHTWHAHDYEPWITAWDLWQPDTVWSGRSLNGSIHQYDS